MKIALTFLLFFVYCAAVSQSLTEVSKRLESALLTKDTVVLRQLLHDDLSYGHSNGWVETRKELIQNLLNGKLTYVRMDSRQLLEQTRKKWGYIRMETELEYVIDGKKGALKMHVLQTWIRKRKGQWQLVTRQSAKI